MNKMEELNRFEQAVKFLRNVDTLNKNERAKAILAMKFIMRNVNDEEYLEPWLMCGVADGDIEHGETDTTKVDDYYTDMDNFRDIVHCFHRVARRAIADGGFYVGGRVISR